MDVNETCIDIKCSCRCPISNRHLMALFCDFIASFLCINHSQFYLSTHFISLLLYGSIIGCVSVIPTLTSFSSNSITPAWEYKRAALESFFFFWGTLSLCCICHMSNIANFFKSKHGNVLEFQNVPQYKWQNANLPHDIIIIR